MAHLERYNDLVKAYSPKVDFLTVYIAEAHPNDGWIFNGNQYDIKTHKNFDERLFAAAMLKRAGIQGPLAVDLFSNEAGKAYAALPERIFLIEDGKITFASDKGPSGYAVGIKAIEQLFKDRFAS